VLFVGFKLNQAEIVRLYCVNKAKPQNQCHGKCHLTKKLAEANHKSEQPSPQSSLEESFKPNLFHQSITALASVCPALEQTPFFEGNQTLQSRLFGVSLFQPPDVQPLTC
jgi:hypothetical protein